MSNSNATLNQVNQTKNKLQENKLFQQLSIVTEPYLELKELTGMTDDDYIRFLLGINFYLIHSIDLDYGEYKAELSSIPSYTYRTEDWFEKMYYREVIEKSYRHFLQCQITHRRILNAELNDACKLDKEIKDYINNIRRSMTGMGFYKFITFTSDYMTSNVLATSKEKKYIDKIKAILMLNRTGEYLMYLD